MLYLTSSRHSPLIVHTCSDLLVRHTRLSHAQSDAHVEDDSASSHAVSASQDETQIAQNGPGDENVIGNSIGRLSRSDAITLAHDLHAAPHLTSPENAPAPHPQGYEGFNSAAMMLPPQHTAPFN